MRIRANCRCESEYILNIRINIIQKEGNTIIASSSLVILIFDSITFPDFPSFLLATRTNVLQDIRGAKKFEIMEIDLISTLVHEAGETIGMNAEDPLLDDIVDKLQKEFIVHGWQVARLDSFQWRTLGAPMGLAIAMQALVDDALSVDKRRSKKEESQRFSSGLTSNASFAIDDNDQIASYIRKTRGKTKGKPFLLNRHAAAQYSEGRPPAIITEEVFEGNEGGNGDSGISKPSGAQEGSEQKEQPDTFKPSSPKTDDSCTIKRCCGEEVATCFSHILKAEMTIENTACFPMSKVSIDLKMRSLKYSMPHS